MDGRRFDDIARSLAHGTSRRRFLVRGAAAAAAVTGGLLGTSSTDAARRGKPPKTSICTPDGAGGYTRVTIDTVLLPGYLATGSLLDNGCCSGSDCPGGAACSEATCNVQTGTCSAELVADGTECTPDGPINLCRAPYTCQAGICSEGFGVLCAEIAGGCQRLIGCNPSTGLCDYGPAPDGTSCLRGENCADGTCADGICLDPTPRGCPSDACRQCGYDACFDICICVFIGCGSDYPECQSASCDPELGCVFTNINEGGPCLRAGVPGSCFEGVCLLLD